MNSMTRKLALLAGLGLAGLTGLSYTPPATAQVIYGVAPPPPRFERVPPVRAGYVWAPGYWRWDGYARRHVWVGGYWVPARRGYFYRPARWEPYGRGYRFHPGYWGR
jgi:WXXGXW repeat (2 copies)